MSAGHAADGFAPADILAKLEVMASGENTYQPLPDILPVSTIQLHADLFQCRPISEAHAGELAKALAGGAVLPPLLVVQVGVVAVLVDGHHRLAAHRMAGREEVAVRYFAGTLREAVLAACGENYKSKLPMSATERADAAWRYVLLGGYSKATIAQSTGVAERTVAYMRSAMTQLGVEAFGYVAWWQARLRAKGADPADMTDDEREDWLECTAQRHADTMARTFAGGLARNPEIAARALAIHFGRKLPAVMAELRGMVSEEEGEGDY